MTATAKLLIVKNEDGFDAEIEGHPIDLANMILNVAIETPAFGGVIMSVANIYRENYENDEAKLMAKKLSCATKGGDSPLQHLIDLIRTIESTRDQQHENQAEDATADGPVFIGEVDANENAEPSHGQADFGGGDFGGAGAGGDWELESSSNHNIFESNSDSSWSSDTGSDSGFNE